jgi:hypothetical protein
MKDPVLAEVFQAPIGGKFAALNILDNHIDTITNNIRAGSREDPVGGAQDMLRTSRGVRGHAPRNFFCSYIVCGAFLGYFLSKIKTIFILYNGAFDIKK